MGFACCLASVAEVVSCVLFFIFFFFNDTATTEIYTLSLHDALLISWPDPRLSGVGLLRVLPAPEGRFSDGHGIFREVTGHDQRRVARAEARCVECTHRVGGQAGQGLGLAAVHPRRTGGRVEDGRSELEVGGLG